MVVHNTMSFDSLIKSSQVTATPNKTQQISTWRRRLLIIKSRMLLNVLEIKMCVGLKKSFESLRNLSTQHSGYQGPGERMLTIKTCRIQIARSFLHQLVLIWKKSLAICIWITKPLQKPQTVIKRSQVFKSIM